jgi:hypothetical protein
MPPKKADAPVESRAARFGRCGNTLKMGVVGLPNVGKSSLFNLLTEQSIPAENYPFCTIEPNEARCALPDARYDHLTSIWTPINSYPAYLQVVDIAGLVRGASEGKGLGNDFLSHIQRVDGVYHVVRAFDDPNIVHVDDTVDPVSRRPPSRARTRKGRKTWCAARDALSTRAHTHARMHTLAVQTAASAVQAAAAMCAHARSPARSRARARLCASPLCLPHPSCATSTRSRRSSAQRTCSTCCARSTTRRRT